MDTESYYLKISSDYIHKDEVDSTWLPQGKYFCKILKENFLQVSDVFLALVDKLDIILDINFKKDIKGKFLLNIKKIIFLSIFLRIMNVGRK